MWVVDRPVENGQLTLQPNGSFTYDPQGFAGIETFEYRIDDGTGLSNAVEVTFVINSPPIANDDQFTIDEDVALLTGMAGGVTQNDVDAESDPLVVTLLTEPEFGTLTLSEDGAVSYIANPDYYGDDSFTYQLSDGEDESNVATANITILPVNDAPSPEDDVYFGLSGELIEVGVLAGVLANDSDYRRRWINRDVGGRPRSGRVGIRGRRLVHLPGTSRLHRTRDF